jgi:NAD(P)-dependent dehydrogenase (short-subunit alcohol dehydrogenase family)
MTIDTPEARAAHPTGSKRLDGKISIITGGSSGMGRTAARLFCQEGARVVLADINVPDGERTADELRKNGFDAVFVETDLTQEGHIERLVQTTVTTYGGVDVLFSNAGVKNPLGRIDGIPTKEWDWVLDVNTKATFLLVKHVVPHMIQKRSGAIVVNGSVAGLSGLPNQSAYNVSKAAELHLTRSVAAEYGLYGIRCNAIAPGPIGGEFATKYIFESEAQAQATQQGIGMIVPLRRMGTPIEVAEVALFLASDASSYVTGAVIPVDGGLTLGIDVIGLTAQLGTNA